MHFLYTDGSHANELNIAGIGGYVLNSKKKEIWSFSNPIYEDMSYHELKALQYALIRCLESNIEDVICYTDELNIVRELKRRDKKENDNRRSLIFNSILKLIPKFKTIEFEYIPREKNKKANELARRTLTSLTSKSSRVEIFQKMNGEADYFKANNLYFLEKYVDKKKIVSLRNEIKDYYVFDLYRNDYDNNLDVYHVDKQMNVTKIYTYIITDIFPQYINAITQTLNQSKFPNIGIMVCPANNDIDLVLRGMKAPHINYSYELNKLKSALTIFRKILIDSDTLLYKSVFQPY